MLKFAPCLAEEQMTVCVQPETIPLSQDSPLADCLWARVDVIRDNPSSAKIILTLSLGTTDVALKGFGGKVRMGLIGVKLRLRAVGGEIPHEERWPEHVVETTTTIDFTEEQRRRRAQSSKSKTGKAVEASKTPKMLGDISNESEGRSETEESSRRNIRVEEWTIRSGGSETNPYWEFRTTIPGAAVQLRLVNQHIAKFLIKEAPCLIVCGIDFMNSDIRILASEGLVVGRAGSDEARKLPVVLAIIRKMVAEGLRKEINSLTQIGAA